MMPYSASSRCGRDSSGGGGGCKQPHKVCLTIYYQSNGHKYLKEYQMNCAAAAVAVVIAVAVACMDVWWHCVVMVDRLVNRPSTSTSANNTIGHTVQLAHQTYYSRQSLMGLLKNQNSTKNTVNNK